MKEYLMKLVQGQTLTRQETHDIMTVSYTHLTLPTICSV